MEGEGGACRVNGNTYRHLFGLLLEPELLGVLLPGPGLRGGDRCVNISRWTCSTHSLPRFTGLSPPPPLKTLTREQRPWPCCSVTLAAFSRISLSCSSFLCLSSRSSCSKNLSCVRTSLTCSCRPSSWGGGGHVKETSGCAEPASGSCYRRRPSP